MTRSHLSLTTLAALALAALPGLACAADKPTVQTFNSKGVKIAYFVQKNSK
jgi:hypothetical protein